jgi:6-phospho-beta-glucosidase
MYARSHLEPFGWQVRFTTDLTAALRDSRIVVHQIRYGGLEGREEDEHIALECGAPPDETLGPGALHSILRARSGLRRMGAMLVENCPNAWILNLTNPLSLATGILLESGLKHCVGLCELPLVTAREASEFLTLPFEDVEWDYAGFNHRGFIINLKYRGQDYITALCRQLHGRTIGGITGDQVRELQALPTKYFSIICGRERPQTGRAAFLAGLRKELADDLMHDPHGSPPSLSKRYLEWYPQSVVPMIVAVFSGKQSRQVLNVSVDSGLIEECHVNFSDCGIEILPSPVIRPGRVARWLHLYRRHEEAMSRCVRRPSLETVAEALRTDPVIGNRTVLPMAAMLWKRYERFDTAIAQHA